jgi:hypothetical protein
VSGSRLVLSRGQILAFRRHVGSLDRRLPPGERSLRIAAWAGLQDSMPRAAVVSIHARVEGTGPSTWEERSLVQVWGPRFSAYVVADADRAVFTRGRMPDTLAGRRRAEDAAARLHEHLAGARVPYGQAGRALGVDPNSLRYGTTTGRILMRWDGARQPTVWTVPPPSVDPRDARMELARRFLHVFGPATVDAFAKWAGVKPAHAAVTFTLLERELVGVRTPLGDAWILEEDEAAYATAQEQATAGARLLPSGDSYFLLWGADRELLVPDPASRPLLWTSRVWPGAILARGEVVGTWRRAEAVVTLQPWRRLTRLARGGLEAVAEGLPVGGPPGRIAVRWDE